MKADQNYYQDETQEQNIYQLFEDYLNDLYYEGYANQLAEEDPQAYEFELTQFIYNF